MKLSEPDESNPHPSNLFFLNINFTLSFTLDSSVQLHDQVLPQKLLGIPYPSPRHACYISHNFLLIILGTNYTVPHCTIFFRLLPLFLSVLSKYFVTTLFSDTLILYYSVSIQKGKVHPCTGAEALYRWYGPQGE